MLLLSDKNILTTTVQEYSVENRFLKLPSENFFKLLEFTPLSPQYAMINAINNPSYRFITACFSRRTGKTYMANLICFLKLLEPNVNVLLVSANYSLASISWNLQKGFINQFKVEVTKSNEKDRQIILANGSTILLASISTIDSSVGRSYDLILFDEAALGAAALTREGFEMALRPTLDRANSKAMFFSTPRGMEHPFYTWYTRGFDSEFPEWVSLRSDYRENPRLIEKDILEAKRSLSKFAFAQEYEASFESSNEGVVFDFDYSDDVLTREELNHVLEAKSRCDKILGVDIGFKDATTGVVIYVLDDTYYVVEEYSQAKKSTEVHATALLEMQERHDCDFSFGDSAAAQVLYDFAYMYDLTLNKANKAKLPGISYMVMLVENHRLKISLDCELLIKALRNYSWKVNNTGKDDTLHEYSDIIDALRYGIYSYSPNMY